MIHNDLLRRPWSRLHSWQHHLVAVGREPAGKRRPMLERRKVGGEEERRRRRGGEEECVGHTVNVALFWGRPVSLRFLFTCGPTEYMSISRVRDLSQPTPLQPQASENTWSPVRNGLGAGCRVLSGGHQNCWCQALGTRAPSSSAPRPPGEGVVCAKGPSADSHTLNPA